MSNTWETAIIVFLASLIFQTRLKYVLSCSERLVTVSMTMIMKVVYLCQINYLVYNILSSISETNTLSGILSIFVHTTQYIFASCTT